MPETYTFRYSLFQLCGGDYLTACQMAEMSGVKDFDSHARGAEWKGLKKYDGWSEYEAMREK